MKVSFQGNNIQTKNNANASKKAFVASFIVWPAIATALATACDRFVCKEKYTKKQIGLAFIIASLFSGYTDYNYYKKRYDR